MQESKLKKIVYIEDDRDIQMIVKFSLEDVGGMEVICYCSGIEAISNIEKDNPDLVLLDIMLPEMDGVEIFEKLSKKFTKLPIIFLTAKGRDDETQDLKKKGAVAVIVKPFDPLTLHERIKNIWRNLKNDPGKK